MGSELSLEDVARRKLCRIMEMMYYTGLITVYSGNASIRLNEREILITPSHVPKIELSPGDIVKIDLRGNVIEGNYSPSIEYRMHLEIYKRTNYTAVVHAHNPLTVALVELMNRVEPLSIETELVLGKEIPVLPQYEPGSIELAKAVADVVEKGHTIVVLRRHGAVAVGDDLYEAYHRLELLEELALQKFYIETLTHLSEVRNLLRELHGKKALHSD